MNKYAGLFSTVRDLYILKLCRWRPLLRGRSQARIKAVIEVKGDYIEWNCSLEMQESKCKNIIIQMQAM